MRLLVLTQTIDQDDLYLGFFCRWVDELAKHADSVTVVCLRVGQYALPRNVTVLSLGKEEGSSFFTQVWRFFRYSTTYNYDTVFVHMNQEYVLLGGWLWWLTGKKVFMWRNHYAGNPWTDMAAAFCTKIFCTSKYSYTAKYAKTMLMPVGVDTELFRPTSGAREPRSILFYARLAPSKQPDVLLEALGLLKARGVEFSAHIYGTPLPKDRLFLLQLKERCASLGLVREVQFMPGSPHSQGPAIFSAHELFVNLGGSGMYDKTIFEAAACGCDVIAASDDWAALAGREFSAEAEPAALAEVLERVLSLPAAQKQQRRERLLACIQEHTLSKLAERLHIVLSSDAKHAS